MANAEEGIYGQVAGIFGYAGFNFGDEGINGLAVGLGVQASVGIAGSAQYGAVISIDYTLADTNLNVFSDDFDLPGFDFDFAGNIFGGIATPSGAPFAAVGLSNSPLTGDILGTFGVGITDLFEFGGYVQVPIGWTFQDGKWSWTPDTRAQGPTSSATVSGAPKGPGQEFNTLDALSELHAQNPSYPTLSLPIEVSTVPTPSPGINAQPVFELNGRENPGALTPNIAPSIQNPDSPQPVGGPSDPGPSYTGSGYSPDGNSGQGSGSGLGSGPNDYGGTTQGSSGGFGASSGDRGGGGTQGSSSGSHDRDGNNGQTDNHADRLGFPVLLDLDGNGLGVDTLATSSRFIDLDGDGTLSRTAWAEEGDGVLILDADGDGEISRSSEFAFTEWDATAGGDLEALKSVFDTNQNGKLDVGDARWSAFKVMVGGQLVSLASLEIASINLTPTGSGQQFEDGSAITGTSTFTRTNGTSGTVGDAVLRADGDSYRIEKSTSAQTTTIEAFDISGGLAFRTVETLSGTTKTTQFDDDGDGLFDRSQQEVVTVAGGETERVVKNFRVDGSLADKTTTTTDANGVTTQLDKDGDGSVDQEQVYVKNLDGSSQTTVTEKSKTGIVLRETVTEVDALGLEKTIKVNSTGNGVDLVTTEVTAINAGTRTTTIESRSVGNGTPNNGTLINVEKTITTATGRTVTRDRDADGVYETQEVTAFSTGANGEAVTTVSKYDRDDGLAGPSDDNLLGKVEVSISQNGRTKMTSTDVDGDGAFDIVSTDVTVVGAGDSLVRTVETRSGGPTPNLLGKTTTEINADRSIITTTTDSNGDNEIDSTIEIVVANGITTTTTRVTAANGSLISKVLSQTLAGGLTHTTKSDLDGDGDYDLTVIDNTVENPAGTSERTITRKNGDGTVQLGETKTTISKIIDSATQAVIGETRTIEENIDPDSVIERTTVASSVLNADQSRTETTTTKAGSVLLGKTTVQTSSDRETVTTTIDANGDGQKDRSIVAVKSDDGSTTTTVADFAANGTQYFKSEIAVSVDRLTTTELRYLDGDAAYEGKVEAVTVIGNDGKRTTTTSETSTDGTLLSRGVVSSSANGLKVETRTDSDGNNVVEARASDETVFNANGSTTRTVSNWGGVGATETLTGQTVTTVSGNGLETILHADLDGVGSFDRTTKTVKELNDDGSTTDTVTVRDGNDLALLARSVTTSTADKRTITTVTDLDGDSKEDVKTVRSVTDTGAIETASTTYYLAPGTISSQPVLTVKSKSTETVSANGLSIVRETDVDGNGTIDLTLQAITTLNSDGSKFQEITESNVGGPKNKTTISTSADGLTKTTIWYATGGTQQTRSAVETTSIEDDGDVVSTVEYFEGNGDRESWTEKTVNAHRNEITILIDIDGDHDIDQTSVTTVEANGDVVTTISDFDPHNDVVGQQVTTTSANGLSSTIDFANGRSLERNVALNDDGSKTETIEFRDYVGAAQEVGGITTIITDGLTVTETWDYAEAGLTNNSRTTTISHLTDGSTKREVEYRGGTTLKSAFETTTSANGLSTTRKWDLDGQIGYEETSTDVTVLQADGSVTRTITSFEGTVELSSSVQTTSADGRTVTLHEDRGELGTRTTTTTTTILADGSRVVDTTIGLEHITTSTDASGREVEISRDINGGGAAEQIESRIIRVDGSEELVITNFAGGNRIDRTTVITSANGLMSTATWDLDGNGTIDRTRVTTNFLTTEGNISSLVDHSASGDILGTTEIIVSADGATRNMWRDVNGDLLTDTHEVTITSIDGSTLTTTSNQSAARWGALLLSGEVSWDREKSAFEVLTSVSADGLLTNIRSDFDGNGSYELVENAIRQIDGSTKSTFSVGGDVGTRFVSADGRTDILKKDLGNDGDIDQIQRSDKRLDGSITLTITDNNANGSLNQKTVEEFNAGGDLISRRITDAQDRLISKTIGSANGNLQDTTFYNVVTGEVKGTAETRIDVSDAHDWSQHTVQRDDLDKTTEITWVLDGGSKDTHLFDSSDKADWLRRELHFRIGTGDKDAFDLLTEDVFMDDGTVINGTMTYDIADAQLWESLMTYRDAASRVTEKSWTYDVGSKDTHFYDVNNTADWLRRELHFTAGDERGTFDLFSEERFMDDGSVLHGTMAYDQADSQVWQSRMTFRNAAGLTTEQNDVMDNGSRENKWFDRNGADWLRIEQYINISGDVTKIIQYNDNGTRSETIFDPNDAQFWKETTNYYNSAGTIIQKVVKDDDNSSVTTLWDRNNQPWTKEEQFRNITNKLTQKITELDNGRTVDHYYDVGNNIWKEKIYLKDGNDTITYNYIKDDDTRNFTTYDYNSQFAWLRKLQMYNASDVLTGQLIYWDDGRVTNYPVVLDLDGDGEVEIRPLDSDNPNGPKFDWDGDGVRDATAWAGTGDGMLVIDLASNGQAGADGIINQARELSFGLWAAVTNPFAPSTTDMEGLKIAFDSNSDNFFNAGDARWDEFRVWNDADQDGVSDSGELKTLAQAGIVRIWLGTTTSGSSDFYDGSAILGTTWFEMANGSRHLIGDAMFALRPSFDPGLF